MSVLAIISKSPYRTPTRVSSPKFSTTETVPGTLVSVTVGLTWMPHGRTPRRTDFPVAQQPLNVARDRQGKIGIGNDQPSIGMGPDPENIHRRLAQEAGDELVCRMIEDLQGGIKLLELAIIEYRDALSQEPSPPTDRG